MPKRGIIVAIIPARYGSTRLPAKPLVDLAGKPMIQHVYERTKKAKLIDRVIVATDDDRILGVVKRFGGEAMMTPSDLRSGSDRVAYAATNLRQASIIVNVQGDEPLVEPAMIDEAVQPLVDDETIDVGTLVKRIEDDDEMVNPNIVKAVLDNNGLVLYFSRSLIPFNREGSVDETYYKHIGLYVFRSDFLKIYASLRETPLERAEKLEQLRILEHGYKIKSTVTKFDSIPVDTREDAEKVRAMLQEISHGHRASAMK